MRVFRTSLEGVVVIEPVLHSDARGQFIETYRESTYQALVELGRFVQDNHSRSFRGVLRGLHFQLNRPQGKLVRVVRGEVFDVAVDVRVGSPNFGMWHGEHLTGDNARQVYIPPGFAHGFCVLSEVADVEYKCTEYYDPEDPSGIRWDDPELAIDWPLQAPLLSEKDLHLPLLVNAALPRFVKQS